MKLHEVVEELTHHYTGADRWFRPATWSGTGEAFAITDGMTKLVPSARGGQVWMTCRVVELMGDWEIVTPDVVIKER